LRTLLHQSPRTFDKPTSLWTLVLAAQVSFEQAVTQERVMGKPSGLPWPLRVRWQRAKEWITSPDPVYARKKGVGPADAPGGHPSKLDLGLRG
jgi:hypothetical protein